MRHDNEGSDTFDSRSVVFVVLIQFNGTHIGKVLFLLRMFLTVAKESNQNINK